jgi:hypothetical protein
MYNILRIGGIFHFAHGGEVTIVNTVMSSIRTSRRGGGVVFGNVMRTNLTGCSFENCVSKNDAGAVLYTAGSFMNIYKFLFPVLFIFYLFVLFIYLFIYLFCMIFCVGVVKLFIQIVQVNRRIRWCRCERVVLPWCSNAVQDNI